jgi:exopolysaccharide biosynthesis polyprenyl glycosylphosphotransferase
MLREHGSITTSFQKFLDIVITAFSFVAAYFIKRHALPQNLTNLSNDPNYYVILLMAVITWYISLNWMGMYISYRQSLFYQFFVKIIKSALLGMVLLNIALYTIHIQHISRLLMGIFLVLNISLLTLSKFIIYKTLRKIRSRGINTRNVLIIGSRERAKDAIRAVEENRDTGYKVLGCFDIERDTMGLSVKNGHRVIGTIEDMKEFLEKNVVDEMVFAMPMKLIQNAGRYLALAETMGVKVRIIPDWQLDHLMYQPGIAEIRIEDFLGLYTMSLQTTPPNDGKLFIKALGDFTVAMILMLISLPVFLFFTVAIKLFAEGPVFYKQERLGLSGRKFTLYKFRTMVENADELLEDLKKKNEADGPAFKIKNDPRIIPWIGTFLRKTSLDELPQLINVLRGEMSLVGPRPPLPSEVVEYSIWQRRRLSMKPGLTCFWQISPRRNDLSFNEWMRLDLKYIDTWSLFNDLKLIVLTLRAMLFGAGR